MSAQGLSIAQAAKKLGVSTRTVRRFIKAGKLKAELVAGTFGPEYRIPEIPAELRKQPAEPETVKAESPGVSAPNESALQTVAGNSDHILLMLKDLQDKNMALAAQLGAATERIRNLENQVKRLTSPGTVNIVSKKTWWWRLFGFLYRKDPQ
jgi:excisionase family DNA binding protein